MNGNVPLTNRVVPDARLSLAWDTGGSGCQTFNGAQSGSILLTGHSYNSCPEFHGIERGSNGSYNESVRLSFVDTWTGATVWGEHQIIFNQSRNYNPPPPATPFDAAAMGRWSNLERYSSASNYNSADARCWIQISNVNGGLTFYQNTSSGGGSALGTFVVPDQRNASATWFFSS